MDGEGLDGSGRAVVEEFPWGGNSGRVLKWWQIKLVLLLNLCDPNMIYLRKDYHGDSQYSKEDDLVENHFYQLTARLMGLPSHFYTK